MVTHFFLYRAVVAMTSIWSRIDWAYKWFNITWEVGSGSNTGSLLSVTSLFSTILSKCGGKIGGPEVDPPFPDPPDWVSKFGLFWPQPFSGYWLSRLKKKYDAHEDFIKINIVMRVGHHSGRTPKISRKVGRRQFEQGLSSFFAKILP